MWVEEEEEEEDEKGKGVDGVGGVGDRQLVFSPGLHHMHHDVPGGEGGGPGIEIRFSLKRVSIFFVWLLLVCELKGTCRSSCPPGRRAPSPDEELRWHWVERGLNLKQDDCGANLDKVSGLLSLFAFIRAEKPEKREEGRGEEPKYLEIFF